MHCEACVLSKYHQTSYKVKAYSPLKPFYLIHSVWGPPKIHNLNGKKWFVSFIDDHTWQCWVYLMKNKSDVEQIFKGFYDFVETQFQIKINILKTDNGTEYFNDYLGTFLKEKGIHHQSTSRDTPRKNSIIEHKNRHLLEVVRSLMFSMHIPKYLWGEGILTSCYLINRMSSHILKYDTPLQCCENYSLQISWPQNYP